MALPVVKGIKTASERFAGAVETFCIEGLMQDGRALQAGTSHFLGQNFAKAFDVKFLNKNNEQEYVWATSWGVSTRLIGALIMTHSDDHGLVLPPKLAPIQVAIIPIFRNEEELEKINEKILPIIAQLKKLNISVKYDDRDTQKPGWKFNEYEFKGVPVRLAIGPRDLDSNSIEVARRDLLTKEIVPLDNITEHIEKLLVDIQNTLYKKALDYRTENTVDVYTWEEFVAQIEKGGFVNAHWDGTDETEEKIKQETKATIRCIPLNNKLENGKCVLTGKPSKQRVLFARAY